MFRFACYFGLHWFEREFNHKYPRWENKWHGLSLPTPQWRYIRTCRWCKREELQRVDLMGYEYWEPTPSAGGEKERG